MEHVVLFHRTTLFATGTVVVVHLEGCVGKQNWKCLCHVLRLLLHSTEVFDLSGNVLVIYDITSHSSEKSYILFPDVWEHADCGFQPLDGITVRDGKYEIVHAMLGTKFEQLDSLEH